MTEFSLEPSSADTNAMAEFFPHPLLRNSHAMTIFPALNLLGPPGTETGEGEPAYVQVSEDSQILVQIHRAANGTDAPCLVLVHGLEGSAASPYLVSLARKAVAIGFNAVRVNLRNCGGTLHLSPTLYNAGISPDIIALCKWLKEEQKFKRICLVGYSLGGNVVLKAAAELGLANSNQIDLADATEKLIDCVCAVSPSIDLLTCVIAMETGLNRLYGLRFVHGLKRKVREKSKYFPGKYDLSLLKKVTGVRSFDELFTAPDAGYKGAVDYYEHASSLRILEHLAVPTLIIASQDDPIVPFSSFKSPKLKSEYITLLAPKFGGHGGFIHHKLESNEGLRVNDRLWAENRILEFCLNNLH